MYLWRRLSRHNYAKLLISYRFPLLLVAIFIANALFLQQSWMSLIQKRDTIIAVKVAQHRNTDKIDSVVMAQPAKDPKFDVEVVITIISNGKNSDSRQKVRNTWKTSMESRRDVKIKVLFFIPTTDSYSPQHDDEIILDFKRKKSGVKTPYDGVLFLMLYDWVQTNCRFKLLLRLKDGVFLRDEFLDAYQLIKAEPNSTRMIWSSIVYDEPVYMRELIDIPMLERFMYQLPPHPQAESFGLSYDIVSLLVQHHRQDFLTYYSVEEVSLGVWLLGSEVLRRNDPRMAISIDCAQQNTFAVLPSDWDKAVDNVQNCGHPCIGSC